MNILDFLILLPIAFFAYRGFKYGLIHEVLGIIGIILAVFLAFQYMDPFSAYLQPYFDKDAAYLPFAAALIIFLGTLILVNIIAAVARNILQTINLNFINRLGGLAFGALKCSIIISALLLVAAGFNMPSQEVRQESNTYPYIIHLAPWAYDTVAAVYPDAENFVDTIQKTIDKHNPIKDFPFLNNNL